MEKAAPEEQKEYSGEKGLVIPEGTSPKVWGKRSTDGPGRWGVRMPEK